MRGDITSFISGGSSGDGSISNKKWERDACYIIRILDGRRRRLGGKDYLENNGNSVLGNV